MDDSKNQFFTMYIMQATINQKLTPKSIFLKLSVPELQFKIWRVTHNIGLKKNQKTDVLEDLQCINISVKTNIIEKVHSCINILKLYFSISNQSFSSFLFFFFVYFILFSTLFSQHFLIRDPWTYLKGELIESMTCQPSNG